MYVLPLLLAAAFPEAPPPDLIPMAKAVVITATGAGAGAEFGEEITVKLVSPGLWSVKGGVTARESLGWILRRDWEVRLRVRELRPGRLVAKAGPPRWFSVMTIMIDDHEAPPAPAAESKTETAASPTSGRSPSGRGAIGGRGRSFGLSSGGAMRTSAHRLGAEHRRESLGGLQHR